MYLIHVSMFLFVLSFEEHDLMPIVMMQGESRVNWFRRKKRHLHYPLNFAKPAFLSSVYNLSPLDLTPPCPNHELDEVFSSHRICPSCRI
jgi:hypothetical protein